MSLLFRTLLLSLLAGGLLWALLHKETTEKAVEQREEIHQELEKAKELEAEHHHAIEEEVEKLKD